MEQWATTGYVLLKPSAAARLRETLSAFGLTFRGLCEEMAARRETVKEVVETRSGYEHEFHYDFILPLPDDRKLYVETVLDMESDPFDSRIVVVSVHEPS
jgi:hypothetical protein